MIRQATLHDRPHFLALWSEYMTEQEKAGGHILANRRNLYQHLDIFESYVEGVVPGTCLLWEPGTTEIPVGLTLAGEFAGGEEWERSLGKVASLWGVYVQPAYRGQGIAVKLFQRALGIGLELGFDTIETYVRTENEHGQRVAKAFGTVPHLEQHIIPLRDPRVLNNDEARRALGREVSNGRSG